MKRPFRFGALSILALVVAVCLAVLAVLSYSTALSSSRLSERYASRVQSACQLDAQGQEWLAQMDAVLQKAAAQPDPEAYLAANLPDENTSYSAGTVTTHLSGADNTQLDVTLAIGSDYTYTVTSWQSTVAWTADTGLGGNLLGS